MSLAEEHVWEGKHELVIWQDASFSPPRELVTQAGCICFTDDGLVVLVTSDGLRWGLPAGHLENGETVEETLIREVKEEACAIVTSLEYLGSQEIHDVGEVEGKTTHYQTRFWARVNLTEFKCDYETTGRKLVEPEKINDVLLWYPSGILEKIIELAMDCERRFAKNKRR